MAIANGDIYRATFRWNLANQICNTVWHIRAGVVPGGTESAVLGNAAAALVTTMTAIAAAQHESVVYDHLTISFVAGNGDPHFHLQDLELEGEQTGEALPGLLALPFYLATGFAGRRFNGRFHWGGLTEALQDDGRLSTAGNGLADAIQAVLEARMGGTNVGGNFGWVVFSRKELEEITAESGLPAAGSSNWVTHIGRAINAVSHGDILGSMYSRKIGRGQ